VNERDETLAAKIDLSQPHVILEKLDGSMITPVYTEAGIRWGTKMGITEVSMQAEVFVSRNGMYRDFAEQCRVEGVTPIFEWCSRKQRIVIDYPEDRLVLLALRENSTGAYVPYQTMVGVAEYWHIPVVRAYAGTTSNMEHLIAETRAMEDAEGWIIRFDDGHMLKIKGEWYLRIHKTKDGLSLEKNVIEMLVNEKLDDVKPFMLDEDRRRVEQFEREFWDGVEYQVETYDRYFATVQASVPDRKTFALNWLPTIAPQDPYAGPIVFGKYDGKDTRTMILDLIRKNCGTQTRVDAARALWNGAQWNYSFDGDA
jgi:RNA ligase